MNYGLLITAVPVALVLAGYSVMNHIPESGFLKKFKIAASLLAALIVLSLIVARTVMLFGGYFNNGPATSLYVSLYVECMVLTLIFCATLSIFIVKKYIIGHYEAKIRRHMEPMWKDISGILKVEVENFIEKGMYLRPNVTVDSMAKDICTNRTYLSAYINRAYNMPFKEWLKNLRLDHAELLMKTQSVNKPLKSIAEECGFGTTHTLSNAFKKRHGITPGKWRESIHGPRYKPYVL